MKPIRKGIFNLTSYDTGKPWRKSFSIKGVFIGLTIYYHENGNLQYVGSYIDNTNKNLRDRRIGLWKQFNSEGAMILEEIFVR